MSRNIPSYFSDVGFRLIFLLGLVALCGDIIYEGARSVTGPYILILGGSAAVVGLVAGAGEFIGYALRLISGYLTDRTQQYWLVTMIGYAMLLSVPLLAFTGHWQTAALFIILERIGKGIRSPAKDAILSHASTGIGRGTGFGIHEALDQTGAVIGPLVFTAVFLMEGSGIESYHNAFFLLLLPFILLVLIIILAYRSAPDPMLLETVSTGGGQKESEIPGAFLPYGIFTFFTMGGFILFPVIAYRFVDASVVDQGMIPLLYAIAMGVDAVVALAIGRAYDKRGIITLIFIPLLNVVIPIFAFFASSLVGVLLLAILWGASLGIQETVLRAAIADFTHISKRGTSYGIFNTIYGGSLFAGNFAVGILYDAGNITGIVAFAIAMQLLSVPAFLTLRRVTSVTVT